MGCLTPAFADEYGLNEEELRAQLAPKKYVTLAAGMSGQIEKLAVREGQQFSIGELLLRFDCALQEAQFDKANAQMEEAINIHNGSQEMAKHNAIGAIELENSRIAIEKAKADLKYLQVILSRCFIKAPYSGSIGRQLAREKEFVQTGQPLLEIQDNENLELKFIVPSKWLSWLKPGYQFQVNIEDTGKQYPAKLEYTSTNVDPMSQSIRAFAIIDGKFEELLPGMSGRLVLSPPETVEN